MMRSPLLFGWFCFAVVYLAPCANSRGQSFVGSDFVVQKALRAAVGANYLARANPRDLIQPTEDVLPNIDSCVYATCALPEGSGLFKQHQVFTLHLGHFAFTKNGERHCLMVVGTTDGYAKTQLWLSIIDFLRVGGGWEVDNKVFYFAQQGNTARLPRIKKVSFGESDADYGIDVTEILEKNDSIYTWSELYRIEKDAVQQLTNADDGISGKKPGIYSVRANSEKPTPPFVTEYSFEVPTVAEIMASGGKFSDTTHYLLVIEQHGLMLLPQNQDAGQVSYVDIRKRYRFDDTRYILLDSINKYPDKGTVYQIHRLERGESLYTIGVQYGTTVPAIRALNPKLRATDRTVLPAGTEVLVGVNIARAKKKVERYLTTHTVVAGDSQGSLATLYNTSTEDIARLNNLSANAELRIGQELTIETTGCSAPPATLPYDGKNARIRSTNTARDIQNNLARGEHTVVQKETLYSISQLYGLQISDLQKFNGIEGNTIKVGQTLLLRAPATQTPIAPNRIPIERK